MPLVNYLLLRLSHPEPRPATIATIGRIITTIRLDDSPGSLSIKLRRSRVSQPAPSLLHSSLMPITYTIIHTISSSFSLIYFAD